MVLRIEGSLGKVIMKLKNGINLKEIYQKRFEDYPETEKDFSRDWHK